MSRTRRMTTAAAAALAAVLGVGVMTAPVGATTALWQDQVTIPGVTVVAAPTPDEPPIVVEPEKPLDPIELPPGHELAFYYTVTLDLSQYELPIYLGLEHGWSTESGSASQFQSSLNQYSVNGGPWLQYRNQSFSATGTARTWHLFYREGEPSGSSGYSSTPVPAETTSVTVRFMVHAVHNDYQSNASFTLSGGRGAASFYQPDASGLPSAEAVLQVPFTLPDLYWNGSAVGAARSAAADHVATSPAVTGAPDAQQPDPAPEPDPTSTDDAATARDEDLEASP